MIPGIAALGGVLLNFVPDIFGMARDWVDHKRELQMMELQSKLAKEQHAMRVEALAYQADIKDMTAVRRHDTKLSSGYKIMDAYRASVRPTVTYMVFGLYVAVDVATVWYMIDNGIGASEALRFIWTPEKYLILEGILGFWFGGRLRDKAAKGRL